MGFLSAPADAVLNLTEAVGKKVEEVSARRAFAALRTATLPRLVPRRPRRRASPAPAGASVASHV